MDIRVVFLAETRAVPTNYSHVEVNDLSLDWLSLGAKTALAWLVFGNVLRS